MVGDQVNVVGQQGFQTFAFNTGNALVFAFPEIAMVHQNGVSPPFNRGIHQRLTGGNAGHDMANVFMPFHLQTIGTIVAELSGLQNGIQSFSRVRRSIIVVFSVGSVSGGSGTMPFYWAVYGDGGFPANASAEFVTAVFGYSGP